MSKTLTSHDLPLKILVVEDSPDDRAMYRRMLRKQPGQFEIYEADTLDKGLAMTHADRMDCILLDYYLPDGDGLRFIENYHGKSEENDAAIVMVTGRGSPETAVEAMKKGALDYISKDKLAEDYFIQSILNAVERGHLRAEVARYQKELEKSNKALSEFAHTVSHDIKAPLRHIASYCSMLNEEYGEKLGEDGRQYAERLVVNAKRLQKLVDDLLDYSQITNVQEEKGQVNMRLLLGEIEDELEELITAEKAQIEIKNAPLMSAYPLRMRQLIQNLVTNAIKYRSEKLPVVTVNGDDMGDHWKWCVTDNGCGIKEEYRATIFEDFKRLHSRDAIEGSGLGLSICKRVVEMHGGRIWVEPASDNGSTFCFTIKK